MHCSNLPVFWRGSQRNMRVMKNSTFKSFVFLGADPENHFLTLIIRAAREGFDPSSIEIHPVCWSCSQFAASHLANTRPPLSPSSPTNHPTMADEEELVDYDEEVRLRRASFVPVNGAQSVRELEERIEGWQPRPCHSRTPILVPMPQSRPTVFILPLFANQLL